jgi:hypothetical protein
MEPGHGSPAGAVEFHPLNQGTSLTAADDVAERRLLSVTGLQNLALKAAWQHDDFPFGFLLGKQRRTLFLSISLFSAS